MTAKLGTPHKLAVAAVLPAVVTGGLFLFLHGRHGARDELTLQGKVDGRKVELAFDDSDRIARMFVQEGDHVGPGQLLAELDSRRYAQRADRARWMLEAQKQALARLVHGSLPEEVTEARAKMDALLAPMRDAEAIYHRDQDLRRQGLIPQQMLDDSESKYKAALASYTVARQAWILATKGPRAEDIDKARATLKADEAALALAEIDLENTRLYAASDGVIESRKLEPGDLASPDAPVFTVALTNPLWVSADVPEAQIGRVHVGTTAAITTAALPGKAFEGRVGWISPNAEVTRGHRVYPVRVHVCSADSHLRPGMGATIVLDHPIGNTSPGCGQQEISERADLH